MPTWALLPPGDSSDLEEEVALLLGDAGCVVKCVVGWWAVGVLLVSPGFTISAAI